MYCILMRIDIMEHIQTWNTNDNKYTSEIKHKIINNISNLSGTTHLLDLTKSKYTFMILRHFI